MAKTTDPAAKPITLFLSPADQREVKGECAKLGKTYTDYFLDAHRARMNALPWKTRKPRKISQ